VTDAVEEEDVSGGAVVGTTSKLENYAQMFD